MPKLLSFLFLIAVLVSGPAVSQAGEMDLYLRSISNMALQKKLTPSQSVAVSKSTVKWDGYTLVPALLKTADPEETIGAIKSIGGRANKITGPFVSAEIPPSMVSDVVAREEVIAAEAALALSSKMDTARTATAVDVVQNGTSSLGAAYDGTNVVVGVVDDALDYGNADFMNVAGTTRIQYIREGSGDDVKECIKKTINSGDCEITDDGQGYNHGTHVTGTAAGSNSQYTGVAPLADIMFVFNDSTDADTSGSSSTSFSTSVIEAVTKIFEKVDILDKAAVINLSLGTSVGAHDGTSLLEEALSSFTSAKPGRIIVGAAGNEQTAEADFTETSETNISRTNYAYIGGIHALISAADGESKAPRLAIINGAGASASWLGGALVDLWLDAGQKDTCSVAVFAYTNGRSPPDFTFPGLSTTSDAVVATGDVPFATSTTDAVQVSGNSVNVAIGINSSDVRNSKPHAAILISSTGTSSAPLQQLWFDIVIRASGGPCTGHMWLYPDYVAYHDFMKNVSTLTVGDGASRGYSISDGDTFYTTTIPATAAGVIAAGSYMPQKPIGSGHSVWTGNNGVEYNQGDIMAGLGCFGTTTDDLSTFSSLGPTADGRTKPDVVTPGEPIISTKARNASIEEALMVGNDHFKDAGTSMASPHLTGIIALLLQRNNTLYVDGVRTAIRTGAGATGLVSKTTDPENSYGAGVVNAVSILSSVEVNTSAYSGTGDLPDSSSSCSLVKVRKQNFDCLLIAISVVVILLARLLLSSQPNPPPSSRKNQSACDSQDRLCFHPSGGCMNS